MAADDVDAAGIVVGVKEGSAYDLHLTRTLQHAHIERGSEGIDVYVERHLDVGAGIRQPMTEWVAAHPGHRVVEPAFMQIRQAVAVPQDRPDAAVEWLRALVDELLASGFVAARAARRRPGAGAGRGQRAVSRETSSSAVSHSSSRAPTCALLPRSGSMVGTRWSDSRPGRSKITESHDAAATLSAYFSRHRPRK